jgi:serine/threonine-protein kinase
LSDALRQQLQALLGTAYTLERELGGGGMSRVFLAREEALGRDVVVKVLAPELAQAVSAERFAREILMAAGLQAPHIVPVLTAGVMADGLPYYTMPFVRGESLRARLQRGDVPLDEAVAILRGVAEALEHAHGRGLVHRDIKPENVLLSGRTAVVTDFGIAKALSASQAHASGGGASRTLTQFGALLGTPAYMAPEQAAGDPADHRADLYAWGVVAYELLAGAHPFAHRSTLQQVVAAHISETPRDLGEVRPGLPAPLGALVMQTLAKRPRGTPADATQLLDALTAVRSGDVRSGDVRSGDAPRASGAAPAAARELDGAAAAAGQAGAGTAPRGRARRVAVAASAVLLALAIVAGALVWRQRAPDPATPPALAVLPFEHQGDSADAYLTDGVTDEIRAKLAGMRDLVVIARASSMQYRATAKTPTAIAGELGVRYLLTGTVQVSGRADARRVIVRPELVEITANRQPRSRWGQPFDAQGADVLRLQGDIAGQVAAAMPGALEGAAGPRVARAPTSDPVAYEAYLRGQAAWGAGSSYDPTSLRRAITFFEQAVARDSGMIAAWSGLARAQAVLYNSFPADSLRRASLAAVRRVLALDPGGGEGHAAMGTYLVYVERTPERAYARTPARARWRRPTPTSSSRSRSPRRCSAASTTRCARWRARGSSTRATRASTARAGWRCCARARWRRRARRRTFWLAVAPAPCGPTHVSRARLSISATHAAACGQEPRFQSGEQAVDLHRRRGTVRNSTYTAASVQEPDQG